MAIRIFPNELIPEKLAFDLFHGYIHSEVPAGAIPCL